MNTDDEQLIDTFTIEDETSDVVLIVDEKKIYAHKSILGKVSLVFNRMLYSNGFLESQTNEIHLPGKDYFEIIELLKCIYPNILKPIDNNNVSYLLPLADEYSILILRKQIERFYISTINSFKYKYGDNLIRLFDLLNLCQIYHLNQFEQIICEYLTDHFDVQHWNKTNELSINLRCHLFEIFIRKQEIKLKDKQIKIKQLEDLNIKQKFEIQRLKSQLNCYDTN